MDNLGQHTPQKINSAVVYDGGVSTPCSSSSKRLISSPIDDGGMLNGTHTGFSYLPQSSVDTPPAKRFHRVRNPFEAALADRLHLPLICSPSLFQRPTTAQTSSTKFEWTIDDVSSLKPANVEPHETQFHDSPDPEYEAKAQLAINSYFKKHKIVPSPIECPLRKQRIILAELNANTPITKSSPSGRDRGTQTELTLPAVLPKFLEEALLPYLHPQLAEIDDFVKQPKKNNLRSNSGNVQDVSLRRKLFDMHNVIVLEEDKATFIGDSTNGNPQSNKPFQQTALLGKLSESSDKSSLCSLSPISATDGLSFTSSQGSNSKKHLKFQGLLNEFDEMEQLSPIQHLNANVPIKSNCLRSSITEIISKEKYRSKENISDHSFTDMSTIEKSKDKFTPERSSSPMQWLIASDNVAENSFNNRISQLLVNNDYRSSSEAMLAKEVIIPYCMKDISSGGSENNFDMLENSNCSQASNLGTPCGKRRMGSRKNLSRSFSTVSFYDSQEVDPKIYTSQFDQGVDTVNANINMITTAVTISSTDKSSERSTFYRTDSGFNEMTSLPSTNQDDLKCELATKSVVTSQNIYLPNLSKNDNMACSTLSKDQVV